MFKRLILAAAILAAALTAPAALSGQHHMVAGGHYPPVELTVRS